ncbi:Hypothetical protein NTJ_10360 [Nesidiocoris tenuis]|uniref:Uncharacterized protein n=1 Tax=Nesidiocoris tenuis TaxID=355587 RepID=A0ABN7B305_9HEMI|nr:Hypothetical protein NTJ_10360 [Nesidiocoris tenuis]
MIQVTRKPANDVMKPSLVSSHAPPNSSSSTDWKLEKYTYTEPALTMANKTSAMKPLSGRRPQMTPTIIPNTCNSGELLQETKCN